nr:retrotransposon protein, putative, Ty1-copia subclass [Tanacetum cinerariifolium]
MLLELKTLFAQQAEQELLQTTRDFHSCKQEEGQSVSSYVLKMKGYIDNLEHLGHLVTLGLGISLILIGLRKEFDGFVQNYKMHSLGKTINELHAMLKLHEQTLPKNNALALYVIRAAELLKKKKKAASGASGSGIFVIKLNTILNRSWIYDTGCGTHICNTTQGLRASRKLKPGALNLYVGNGQREAIEAIGIFYLCLPSEFEIVLNNCHYAPSITRGVISVSCLYEDGFINRFVNNTIQVSRNNMVYFSAFPRDGIFEIDLSNSYTNESCIYVVSNKKAKLDLDSALLWHCRLGHISKKRIEKLQHDGLLDSTDLRAFKKMCLLYVWKDGKETLHTSSGKGQRLTWTNTHRYRMCLYIDAEEHELGHLGEPANYKVALLDTGFEKWLNAMHVEMQSMKDNEVWVLVELPPYGKTVGSKWLFKKKTDMDGVVRTYKARLVGKGYTETPGIDYEETFSPVANIKAIKILIAIATYYEYEIWQMDVKTPFLNGYLNEEVYMEQPEGFVNPKYPNRVCKLKRSIYGLKQASRQWNKRFDDEINKFGFTQNRDDPCVYLKASGSNITFLILYVDDILIMENNTLMLQSVKSYIGRCFAMKYLGEAAYILGIKIYKDRSRRLIGLCQSAYIEKILKRYCMKNSKREIDYESDPRVPIILGRPFLRTARALIDVHGEEMILHDGDERLTLNMKHDTASYSNHPHRDSVNLINIFNLSSEDCLEDLVSNPTSGNPTFSLHKEIASSDVIFEIHDSKGCTFLSEEFPDIDSFNDIHSHFDDDPLSGSTTYSANSLLEEFADELALISYPSDYDDDHQSVLANLDDLFVDPTPDMFTEEQPPDYSFPPRFDMYPDDFLEIESDANFDDDTFDSEGKKMKRG